MKHYHSSLATAIMMALLLPASAQLANVGVGNAGIPSFVGDGDRAVRSVTSLSGDNIMEPDARFDFGTGVTYIPTPEGGVIFATELFGKDRTLPDPHLMAVVYTMDTPITSDFKITFTVDNGAAFANNPQLGVNDVGGQWTKLVAPVGGGQGQSSVTFVLPASSNKPLASGDQLLLLYQLANAGVLKTAGQKISLKVSSQDSPSQSIVVARSAQAISAKITPNEVGNVYIAVITGSTQFSSETVANGGYIDNNIAQIGTLNISTAGPQVKREDGISPFVIGEGQVEATGKLQIQGGQFQASAELPGKVDLSSMTEGDFSFTGQVEGNSATWNLDTATLATLAASAAMPKASSGDTAAVTGSATIRIQTDGKTAINTVSYPPRATFTLDFSDSGYQDLTVAGNLRKILQDGTVCTVFNIPPPAKGVVGADQLNIRVTNESAFAAKLMGKLYGPDGGDPIWSGHLTEAEVKVGATVLITSEKIATISRQPWDGRAVLEIMTNAPRIEVLALIRQNGIPFAPLSNLSEGVAPSCRLGRE